MRYLERAVRALWGFLLWTHPVCVLLASGYELVAATRAARRALGLQASHVAAVVVLFVAFSLVAITALLLRISVPSLLTLSVGTGMALILGKGWAGQILSDMRRPQPVDGLILLQSRRPTAVGRGDKRRHAGHDD